MRNPYSKNPFSKNSESGTALVAGMALTAVMVGAAALYLLVSHNGYEMSKRELDAARAQLASEEGLHLVMAELKTGVDSDGNGVGTIEFTGPDGRIARATATDLGGNLYRLISVGTVPRAALGTQVLAELIPSLGLSFPARAAITANGPVTTRGNIEIDGRNWDSSGATVVGPGVFGISSSQGINNTGSSSVGGNGIAPLDPPDPASLEENASWADGIDDDGDGMVDEEAFDGIDNDGDGAIDEDTNDYPSSPDVFFKLSEGTLKSAAQAAGTYFATESALNAWIAANGGQIPGGVLVFIDFQTWQPADFGNQFNDPPSVIIHHRPAGDALIKNLHGAFKGLLITDFVEHINGDSSILGSLMSFSDEAYGNAYGNGNAEVRYSSSVLGSLPPVFPTTQVRVLSWSRAASQ